jgi:hypothetical protein
MRRCASRPTRLLVAIRDFMRVRHIGPWKWIVPGSRRIRSHDRSVTSTRSALCDDVASFSQRCTLGLRRMEARNNPNLVRK